MTRCVFPQTKDPDSFAEYDGVGLEQTSREC